MLGSRVARESIRVMCVRGDRRSAEIDSFTYNCIMQALVNRSSTQIRDQLFAQCLLACSQTLYFLFKVGQARGVKNKNSGGFIDRQCKGVEVGEEDFFFLALARFA